MPVTNTGDLPAVEGFLLTRAQIETPGGYELVFWLCTKNGPLRVAFSSQESVSFYPTQYQQQVKTALADLGGWRTDTTELHNFQWQKVSALYCKSQKQLFNAKDRLRPRGIHLQEADIRPADRFLMERFITGAMAVSGDIQQEKNFSTVRNPNIRPAKYRPQLKAVSIDIETDFRAETLYSIALYGFGIEEVLMMGACDSVSQSRQEASANHPAIHFFQNQKALLEFFVDRINALDPDVIMGWNVVNFDFRALQRFANQSGVKLSFARGGETIGWRRARDSQDRYFALMPGRVILDGIELMRTATYQFENFSLEHVAQELLGRGKLIEDVDLRGAEISQLFHTDKAALARYNLEDCRLVWDIFAKEDLLGFAIARSALTGLDLDRYGGSVAAFDFLYLPSLHRNGFVAPALEQLQPGELSPGGYVMSSVPGIHDNVIVLDFKSLYPSIIRTFHIDPMGLVLGLKESDAVPGFDGGKFSRHKFLLPQLIENLWTARDQAKASQNAVLSQAIKIIMNSFYGVLGTSGCRFFDSRLVSSITRRGHEIIIQSKTFLEENGYQVIYGDTDSVFVLLGKVDPGQVGETGRSIARQLNQWWQEKLLKEYQLESFLEMEFETHFTKFLMPTVRGSETGSKKRYAGLLSNGEVLFKGLETVRSDWSPLARDFQQVLYKKVFLGEPVETFIKDTVAGIREGGQESRLVLRKRLRRKLADYVKNVPPHVQAARKAEQIRQDKNLPSLYESGGWVEYVMTTNGPEPRQYRQSPIDFDFYVDKQLAPIADSILVFQQSSMATILDQQIGLF